MIKFILTMTAITAVMIGTIVGGTKLMNSRSTDTVTVAECELADVPESLRPTTYVPPRRGGPIAVEQTEQVIPNWKPRVREFTLKDGTRCIAISTRATNFPKNSGFSGMACDWEHKHEL